MEKGHTMVGWDFHPQLTSAFDAARQILPALALATPGVRGLRGWFNEHQPSYFIWMCGSPRMSRKSESFPGGPDSWAAVNRD